MNKKMLFGALFTVFLFTAVFAYYSINITYASSVGIMKSGNRCVITVRTDADYDCPNNGIDCKVIIKQTVQGTTHTKSWDVSSGGSGTKTYSSTFYNKAPSGSASHLAEIRNATSMGLLDSDSTTSTIRCFWL